jgi:hypothetical protein
VTDNLNKNIKNLPFLVDFLNSYLSNFEPIFRNFYVIILLFLFKINKIGLKINELEIMNGRCRTYLPRVYYVM